MSVSMQAMLLALLAAMLNASIGPFSKVLLQYGFSSIAIAFYKTVLAWLLLVIITHRQSRQHTWTDNLHRCYHTCQTALLTPTQQSLFQRSAWRPASHIALCAFMGIFVLYHFETSAYQYGHAANVVVILMASSAISAVLFARLLLATPLRLAEALGMGLAVAGVLVASWQGQLNTPLLVQAALGGSGYGLFSVLIQRFGLQGSLLLTKYLLMFGSAFLAIPFVWRGWVRADTDTLLGHWQWLSMIDLLALSILPTLLGFYCTTKALQSLSAASVQVTELAEPIFAAVLAWWWLREVPSARFGWGALLIVLGIAVINRLPKPLYRYLCVGNITRQ